MDYLTKEEIFAAEDLAGEDVPVPEWGEGRGVRVLALSVKRRDVYLAAIDAAENAGDDTKTVGVMSARLVVHTVVDAGGNLIFTDADIPMLLGKSYTAVHRLARVAQRLNGFGGAAAEQAEKNSAASPS